MLCSQHTQTSNWWKQLTLAITGKSEIRAQKKSLRPMAFMLDEAQAYKPASISTKTPKKN